MLLIPGSKGIKSFVQLYALSQKMLHPSKVLLLVDILRVNYCTLFSRHAEERCVLKDSCFVKESGYLYVLVLSKLFYDDDNLVAGLYPRVLSKSWLLLNNSWSLWLLSPHLHSLDLCA